MNTKIFLTAGKFRKAYEELVKAKYIQNADFYGVCLSATYLDSNDRYMGEVGSKVYDEMPIMLDSGSFQTNGGKFGNKQDRVEWDRLMEIADRVNPEVTVIDDIIGDQEATIQKAEKRIDQTDRELMAPIQDLDNAQEIYDKYVDLGYRHVGLPYHAIEEKIPQKLSSILRSLETGKAKMHVLGCPINPESLKVLQQHGVHSIDSSSHVSALINTWSDHPMARPKSVDIFLKKNTPKVRV